MAELRLDFSPCVCAVALGAGVGGTETGPSCAEQEPHGRCDYTPYSRAAHAGVLVGQLPTATAPRGHIPSILRRFLCSQHRVRCGETREAHGTRSMSW